MRHSRKKEGVAGINEEFNKVEIKNGTYENILKNYVVNYYDGNHVAPERNSTTGSFKYKERNVGMYDGSKLNKKSTSTVFDRLTASVAMVAGAVMISVVTVNDFLGLGTLLSKDRYSIEMNAGMNDMSFRCEITDFEPEKDTFVIVSGKNYKETKLVFFENYEEFEISDERSEQEQDEYRRQYEKAHGEAAERAEKMGCELIYGFTQKKITSIEGSFDGLAPDTQYKIEFKHGEDVIISEKFATTEPNYLLGEGRYRVGTSGSDYVCYMIEISSYEPESDMFVSIYGNGVNVKVPIVFDEEGISEEDGGDGARPAYGRKEDYHLVIEGSLENVAPSSTYTLEIIDGEKVIIRRDFTTDDPDYYLYGLEPDLSVAEDSVSITFSFSGYAPKDSDITLEITALGIRKAARQIVFVEDGMAISDDMEIADNALIGGLSDGNYYLRNGYTEGLDAGTEYYYTLKDDGILLYDGYFTTPGKSYLLGDDRLFVSEFNYSKNFVEVGMQMTDYEPDGDIFFVMTDGNGVAVTFKTRVYGKDDPASGGDSGYDSGYDSGIGEGQDEPQSDLGYAYAEYADGAYYISFCEYDLIGGTDYVLEMLDGDKVLFARSFTTPDYYFDDTDVSVELSTSVSRIDGMLIYEVNVDYFSVYRRNYAPASDIVMEIYCDWRIVASETVYRADEKDGNYLSVETDDESGYTSIFGRAFALRLEEDYHYGKEYTLRVKEGDALLYQKALSEPLIPLDGDSVTVDVETVVKQQDGTIRYFVRVNGASIRNYYAEGEISFGIYCENILIAETPVYYDEGEENLLEANDENGTVYTLSGTVVLLLPDEYGGETLTFVITDGDRVIYMVTVTEVAPE